jgi:hypothetical protein
MNTYVFNLYKAHLPKYSQNGVLQKSIVNESLLFQKKNILKRLNFFCLHMPSLYLVTWSNVHQICSRLYVLGPPTSWQKF